MDFGLAPDLYAHAIDVLTLSGDRIAEITAFMDAEPFGRFGLPEELGE